MNKENPDVFAVCSTCYASFRIMENEELVLLRCPYCQKHITMAEVSL